VLFTGMRGMFKFSLKMFISERLFLTLHVNFELQPTQNKNQRLVTNGARQHIRRQRQPTIPDSKDKEDVTLHCCKIVDCGRCQVQEAAAIGKIIKGEKGKFFGTHLFKCVPVYLLRWTIMIGPPEQCTGICPNKMYIRVFTEKIKGHE
jgi:hypothetical protein